MSTFLLEQVLHDLSTRREARKAFAHDPVAFLAGYPLEPAQADLIARFDVAALQKHGVSPLLTYGFWMMNEPGRSRAQYLARLRQAS